jgi:S1-C subfamily serine protease
MKKLITIILLFSGVAFAEPVEDMQAGTGFFVNSRYIVTAYHVVENYGHTCYYDIENDTCYQVRVVDYDSKSDIALLKLKETPVNMPMVCRIAHSELPIGEKLTAYGYPQPFTEHEPTIIPMNIRLPYNYDGDVTFYRMTGLLLIGMSGGPNFTSDGKVGGVNKSISLVEQNTSNLVKSTEVIRMLRRNGVTEYPNTKNVKKCVISILNSLEEFKSAHHSWGV